MAKYFGTDGIRGEFGTYLTQELVEKVGLAAAKVLGPKATVCIGMDPRESSATIEQKLIETLTLGGVVVHRLGVISSPVISHAIIQEHYDAGIMISASHNPFSDNGIKFFGHDGKKISDEIEAEIELAIEQNYFNFSCHQGNVVEYPYAVENYIDYLVGLGVDLSGVKIGLDCANGSATNIAPTVFSRLGASISVIGNQPDGKNINENVGSTHPETLAEFVQAQKLDYGFAFDGDADRIMLVDANGEVLDGDYIIYLIAKKMQENNQLNNNLVVGTVMANLGFKAAIAKLNITCHETAVGDRFVMQSIQELNASLGGEQSGHIIIPELLPTGDGILTAVYLSTIFQQNPDQLANLKNELIKFPQLLVNLVVAEKDAVMNSPILAEAIKQQEANLTSEGRILVRASGTESLVRVMVEAKTLQLCEEISAPIIATIKKI